jgi:trk system potassium uptake protein TrkA
MLVVAIRRDGQWAVPHGEDEILADDLVYFAMDVDELENVLTLLGLRRGMERRVMIAGASRIGVALAERLEAENFPVALLDPSRARADAAAAELTNTVVVHGSPTDRTMLVEEGADRVESFVGCADGHEENVVACLLARRLGAAHTFALVDNPALSGLIGDLGIDAIISPRQLSVGLALQFARKGRVKAVATLMEDAVEVIDVEAAPAVQRGDRLLVPGGDDRIEPGDEVLLITTTRTASRLDPFLEG